MNTLSRILVLCFFSSLISCDFAKGDRPSGPEYIPKNAYDLFSYWKNTPREPKLKSFTFRQETIRYEDGSPLDTSIWHEIISYPNSFRIDLGPKENQNSNLYRNDSIYVLRSGEIVHKGRQIQEFMITEGALYNFSIDSTMNLLKSVNINPMFFDSLMFKDRLTYIIGSKNGDLGRPQIWLDANERYVVRRFMELKDESLLEVTFDEFELIDGHLIETWLEFFKDGELIQTERYYDIKVNPDFNPDVFDPANIQNNYWW